MASHINTFSGGMVQDVDPHLQASNTYRYALNGRVIYNTGADAGSTLFENEESDSFFSDTMGGMTAAFASERGTFEAIRICPNYSIIGMLETRLGLLICSTNGTNSQIGVFNINDDLTNPSYRVLFDDKNDPNGDKLNWRKLDQPNASSLQLVNIEESQYVNRVYINDGVNEKRVFNLYSAYKESAYRKPYQGLTTFHRAAAECGYSLDAYPKHLSVHNMNARPDLIFALIKFVRRIDGQLRRGMYQYAMRYKTLDGHTSVWNTLTKPITVTGTHYPDNPEYLVPISTAPFNGQNGYSHHNRFMSSTSNSDVTEDGVLLEIKGIDRRWSKIEVAYMYHSTSDAPQEAAIFYEFDIKDGEVNIPSVLMVEHKVNAGIPIAPDEFNTNYETILRVDAMAEKNNRLYDFGVKIGSPIEVESGTVVEPTFRYLNADQTTEPNFSVKSNPFTGKNDGNPATNTIPGDATIQVYRYKDRYEEYQIESDYYNYKGQQVAHLLGGYFRGETYGYGALFRDTKGSPMFVQHLSDFTFPEQYDTSNSESCSLTKSRSGLWDLRIMGAKISNLKIKKSNLFDDNGKLKVGSIEIVRTKRKQRLKYQGVLLPCIGVSVSCDKDFQFMLHVKPLPFLKNKFDVVYEDGIYHKIAADTYGERHKVLRDDVEDKNIFVKNPQIGEDAVIHPGYSMFYSPDLMIEGAYDFVKDVDKVKIVGAAHKAYVRSEIPQIGAGFPLFNINHHNYAKLYDTTSPNGDSSLLNYGRPKVGSDSWLKFGELISDSWYEKEGIDPDRKEMKFRNGYLDVAIADRDSFDDPNSTGTTSWKIAYGAGVRNSLFLGTKDFEHVDIHTATSSTSARIANYIRPTTEQETSDNLDVRQYISTGHFQPITQQVLDSLDQDADHYIFNGIEVWGGDCYVNYFDFTKTMSQAKFSCGDDFTATRFGKVNVCDNIAAARRKVGYRDYSYSMIFPVESKYNLALRYGRSYAKVGTMPQETYCDNAQLQFAGSINDKAQESFDINKVLTLEENVQFFFTKPKGTAIVTEKPFSVYVSQQKVYGESDDSFRKTKVLDFCDLNGSFGKVTKAVRLFNYLYVFQERAYGLLRTSERAYIPSTVGEVLLGAGKDLDGIDYVNEGIGCQHPDSLGVFDNAVYWIDAAKGLACRHSQAGKEELSNENSMHDFFSSVLPYFDRRKSGNASYGRSDIVIGYSQLHKDIYWTLKGKQHPASPVKDSLTKTVFFNKSLSVFHGFSSGVAHLYGQYRNFMVSASNDRQDAIYLHHKGKVGHYYGQYYKTVLTFVVNPSASIAKVFDNAKMNVESKGVRRIGKIELVTQFVNHELRYQKLNVLQDSRFLYREASLRFPLFQLGGKSMPRLRDHLMTVRIEIDNENQELDSRDFSTIITSFETIFRASNRV